MHQAALTWPDGFSPDQIVDDGGDATLLLIKGLQFENEGKVPAFNADKDSEEWGHILKTISSTIENNPGWFQKVTPAVRGISEETTTGVHRSSVARWPSRACCPSRRSMSTTRSPRASSTMYGCRHCLSQPASDVMLSGKVAVVCGYGDVGKGCCQSLKGQGCRAS
ncbi:MAG: adenosylhomocysteinase [Phycisphaerales bacterium]